MLVIVEHYISGINVDNVCKAIDPTRQVWVKPNAFSVGIWLFWLDNCHG